MGGIARTIAVIVLVLGLLLLAAGVVVHVILPGVVKKTLKEDLVLDSPRSDLYSAFVGTSDKVPIYMTYYLFNVTNAAEVMMGMAPQLVEVGPYVYKERQWKPEANLSWHPNGTITYVYKTEYDFQPDMSAGTEEDPIVTVDLGFLGVIKATESDLVRGELLKIAFARAADKAGVTSLFVTHSVRDVLWGYNDTLLAQLLADLPDLKALFSSIVALQSNRSVHTGGAPSACYSGGEASKTQPAPPPDSVGQMTMWEGMTTLDYWGQSEWANMINGTDGTIFHPNFQAGESAYAFVDTMYRSVLLSNVGEQREDFEGVSLLRLVIDPSSLQAASENPANEAFGIQYQGIQPAPLNLAAPIYFSKPYFLDANLSNVHLNWTSLGYAATGPTNDELRPLYETFLDVEPHTGQPFHIHKRLQVNAEIGEIFYPKQLFGPENLTLNFTRGIQKTFIPIMWADEHAKVSSSIVSDFKKDVLLPIYLAQYGGIIGAVVGAVIAMLSAVCLIRSVRRSADSTGERDPLHGDYTHSMNKV